MECSNGNMSYNGNRDIAGFECDFMVKNQLGDGSFNITWKRDGQT